jgi:hypothetical protein
MRVLKVVFRHGHEVLLSWITLLNETIPSTREHSVNDTDELERLERARKTQIQRVQISGIEHTTAQISDTPAESSYSQHINAKEYERPAAPRS